MHHHEQGIGVRYRKDWTTNSGLILATDHSICPQAGITINRFFFKTWLCLTILWPFGVYAVNGHTQDLATEMATATCRDQETFGKCPNWDTQGCLERARQALAICLRWMPKRPPRPTQLFPIGDKPDAFGQWGIDFGHCGEYGLFVMHARDFGASCSARVQSRTQEYERLPSRVPKRFFLEKSSSARAIWIFQAIPVLLLGLLAPTAFFMAVGGHRFAQRFRTSTLWLGTLVSVGGGALGVVVSAHLGHLSEGLRLHGDNPAATGGTTIGFVLLTLCYWLFMPRIFRRIVEARPATPASS